jgi:hypothetical protein
MPLAFGATIIIAYLPYLSVGPSAAMGFLPDYAREQGLIGGEQFYLLSLMRRLSGSSVPNAAFVILAVLLMTAISVRFFLRRGNRESQVKRAALLATAATVLFAPHYSWYFAWLVPFLCFVPLPSLFYLTAASFVLYLTWLGDKPDEMFRLNSFLYVPFIVLGAVELFAWRRNAGRPGRLRNTPSEAMATDSMTK